MSDLQQVVQEIEATLGENGLITDLVRKILSAIMPMILAAIEAELKKLLGVAE